MVRKWSLVWFLSVGMMPLGVWALGLGDINLHSALNQNFAADIKLLSVAKGEIDGIKVVLASKEAFDRVGAERPYILTKLHFKTERLDDGEVVIQVTSREAIQEPFLNFLIEVNWPKGRMVREYTVLLDPPLTLDRKPAPVQVTEASVTSVSPPEEVSSYEDVTEDTPSASAGEYGPVRRTETLWKITKQVGHDGVGMHQMMMSLFRANPHAFYRDNINNLKVGQIFRVPSREEVMALGAGEARELYRQQMQEWQIEKASVTPVPLGETLPAAVKPVEKGKAPVGLSEAELRIATAHSEGEGEAGPGEDLKAAETIAYLEQGLLVAQEATESAIQQGDELHSRVTDLEGQLNDLQRLLALKTEQLARMQAAASRPAGATPAVESFGKPQDQENLLDTLFSHVALIAVAVGVVVILLALLWIVVRRRQELGEDFQESILINTHREESDDATLEDTDIIDDQDEASLFPDDFSPNNMDMLQDGAGELDYSLLSDASPMEQVAEETDKQPIPDDHSFILDDADDLEVLDNADDLEILDNADDLEILDDADNLEVLDDADDLEALAQLLPGGDDPKNQEEGITDFPQDEKEIDILSLDDLELDVEEGSTGDKEAVTDIYEVTTKLDLARAYVDMGDADGARELLEEVLKEGDEAQKQAAQKIVEQFS